MGTVVGGLGIAYSMAVVREGEALVAEAEARLAPPFLEAPGVDRIQASSVIALLERARSFGRTEDRVRGLTHYAHALEDFQRGDLILAENELEGAHRFLGDAHELRVLAGALSRARLRFDDADVEVTSALAEQPDDARARLLAADVAIERSEDARALEHLEHLATLVPESSVVQNRLGVVFERLGRAADAERAYRDAARLDGRGHDAWVNLGRILRARGDHEGAFQAFTHAVDRASTDDAALLGRGLSHAALGRVDDAAADFRRAAEIAPNDAEPLLALGDLQRDLGRVDEAVATYREALHREDADAASWLKLGNALALSEDYQGAARAFREAIDRSAELSGAHNGLGASLMHLGDMDGARRSLSRASELDPTDPNPLMNLGLLEERVGDRRAAIATWSDVTTRWPGLELAQRRLARLRG